MQKKRVIADITCGTLFLGGKMTPSSGARRKKKEKGGKGLFLSPSEKGSRGLGWPGMKKIGHHADQGRGRKRVERRTAYFIENAEKERGKPSRDSRMERQKTVAACCVLSEGGRKERPQLLSGKEEDHITFPRWKEGKKKTGEGTNNIRGKNKKTEERKREKERGKRKRGKDHFPRFLKWEKGRGTIQRARSEEGPEKKEKQPLVGEKKKREDAPGFNGGEGRKKKINCNGNIKRKGADLHPA